MSGASSQPMQSRVLIAVRWALRALGGALIAMAALLGLEGSGEPVLLGSSALRLLLVAILVLLGAAFFLASKWLAVPMALAVGSTILSLLAAELLLRAYPLILPDNALLLAPSQVRARAAAIDSRRSERGAPRRFHFGQRRSDFVVEGFRRRFVPNLRGIMATEDPEDPLVPVMIDEAGYRNPPGLYGATSTFDIVLLGDSQIYGTSRLTVADYLRQFTGLTVYSLGDPGGAPQHWLLAFEAFKLAKRSRLVIANFYEGNDTWDASLFQQVLQRGVSPEAYFDGSIPDAGSAGDRWSARLLEALQESVFFRIMNGGRKLLSPLSSATATIAGTQAEFRYLHAAPPFDEGLERILEWIESTLIGLDRACEGPPDVRCVVVLSYIPSNSTVYGDRFATVTNAPDRTVYTESHLRQEQLSGRLAEMAQRVGVKYIDITARLRESGREERLYGGMHFNQIGYQTYAALLLEELRAQELVAR